MPSDTPISPVAPEGYPFVLIPASAGMFASLFGYHIVAALCWGLGVAFLVFFRNPSRVSAAPPWAILAPADGKVTVVDDAPSAMTERGFARQVSIFMSALDVHVNRAPISGTVLEVRHAGGTRPTSFGDTPSEPDKHALIVLEGNGLKIAYTQNAGVLARRVTCDLKPGDRVERGQRVGLARHSSRIDVFLPAGPSIVLEPGQRTRAGLTVIANSVPAGA